jgi:hypothetical protein
MGSSAARSAGFVLILVAIIELASAAVLWLVFADLPVIEESMRLTAVILGITGVLLLAIGLVLWRRARATDRISTAGQPGTARILGVAQTGVFVNRNPQVALDLEVEVLGRSPYRVTVREVVPLVLLNRLQGTLPIRVDPADPQKVVVQWGLVGAAGPAGGGSVGAAGGGFGGPGSSSDESLDAVARAMAVSGSSDAAPVYAQPGQESVSIEQLRAWLRANGLSGTARIDRLEDSGQTVGDERLFTMTTTVSVPGRATITTAPSAAMVPLEKVGRIAVGVVLPVRVHPENENLLMFEWDRI